MVGRVSASHPYLALVVTLLVGLFGGGGGGGGGGGVAAVFVQSRSDAKVAEIRATSEQKLEAGKTKSDKDIKILEERISADRLRISACQNVGTSAGELS